MDKIIACFNKRHFIVCVLLIILSSTLTIFGNSYLPSTNYEILSLLVASYLLLGLFIVWITKALNKINLFTISVLFIFLIPYVVSSIYLLIIPSIFEFITLRKINVVSSYDLKQIALIFIAFSSMYVGYFLSINNLNIKLLKLKKGDNLNIYTIWLLILNSIISINLY